MSIRPHPLNFKRLPTALIVAIVVISVLPWLLHQFLFDFISNPVSIDVDTWSKQQSSEIREALFESFGSVFIHLLLEWSAVGIAILTAVLAFIQYRLKGNPATPIIGIALLSAGFTDGFHAMASTRLVSSVADNSDFIPFTWALSRLFNATILLIGIGVVLLGKRTFLRSGKSDRVVFLSGIIFLVIAYGTVRACANTENLPSTMFADVFIKRPYDIVPLFVFIFLGLWLLPKYYKKEQSAFSHAIVWSMVPAVATQLHMAFGSFALHDAHFNMGHFLKVISYLVPFTGLTLDYISTYRLEQRRVAELAEAKKELERKNTELEQFAYITSHDLQEPLRTVISFSELLAAEYREGLDEEGNQYVTYINQASSRMSSLIKGLLDYSRIGKNKNLESIDVNELFSNVKSDLDALLYASKVTINTKDLPVIIGYRAELRMLFQNLLSNAVKYQRVGTLPEVSISATADAESWQFAVRDNGIGIDEKYLKRIFLIFQRLHTQTDYEGTGIGLAHCLKIVELHQGEIWVESTPGEGSTFFVRIPKVITGN